MKKLFLTYGLLFLLTGCMDRIVLDEYGGGFRINHYYDSGINYPLANMEAIEYCKAMGLGNSAKMTKFEEGGLFKRTGEYHMYYYKCLDTTDIQSNPNLNISSDKSKIEDCKNIGFKEGTNELGACVLKMKEMELEKIKSQTQ